MSVLKLKAQILPGSRKADGSVTLKFVTAEEIDTAKFAEIDSYRQQNGWLLFKLNDFDDKDIPKDNADVEGSKTPSERLRSVLYVLHIQNGGKKADFPTFYKEQMDRFIDLIKSKLE